jgi:hypothetical protein
MQKTLQLFHSFDDAERADDEYYASLTPQQRLDILLDLIAAHREFAGETATRLERVCRLTQLSRD